MIIKAAQARETAENFDPRESKPYKDLVTQLNEKVTLAATQGKFATMVEVPYTASKETIEIFTKDIVAEGYKIKNIHKMDGDHEISISW